jgi:hypothetical protein
MRISECGENFLVAVAFSISSPYYAVEIMLAKKLPETESNTHDYRTVFEFYTNQEVFLLRNHLALLLKE